MIELLSKNTEETVKLGTQLARHLKGGDIVCLFGELGSGKTTFTKGIAKGLKITKESVISPSFVFMNIYEGQIPLYHFDLYRLQKTEDIFSVGYEEFMYGGGVAVVEWAQRLGKLLPKDYVSVQFDYRKDDQRLLKISAVGKRSAEILKKFKK